MGVKLYTSRNKYVDAKDIASSENYLRDWRMVRSSKIELKKIFLFENGSGENPFLA